MIILSIIRDILHDAADSDHDIHRTITQWCASKEGQSIIRSSGLSNVSNLADSLAELSDEYRKTGRPLSRRQIITHVELNLADPEDESQLFRGFQNLSQKHTDQRALKVASK
ncbi:hypothetical protein [Thalassococcus lentus]|uniref:Uncharacterized protein n=1 Tax=Thalassococcus lentus TaxID=1210524 RepID=A0ABT4XRI3_9RHOB|nr:hypothetical protein [Thalassococcus lentus]MDA7424567.1 hypothetical protein [Thalassococcus lentus]